MIRAKFKVDSTVRTDYASGVPQIEIKLSPVHSGSEENKAFYHATPGGSISLNIVKPEVAAQFEPGKSYYVDFTSAD